MEILSFGAGVIIGAGLCAAVDCMVDAVENA